MRPASLGPAPLRPAAVLIGLAAYPEEIRLILTQRTAGLRDHSGQIAFPGGKIEARDQSPAAAALREAHEEIGLDPRHVEPLGYLEPYATHTGFLLCRWWRRLPRRSPSRSIRRRWTMPFAFLMDAANHALHDKKIKGKMRHFHAMPYGTRNIWGVTASILRNLYERLYG